MSLYNNTKLADMAKANLNETRFFPCDTYNVCVYSNEVNQVPHFHVISKREKFDIRLDLEGNILSVKEVGTRSKSMESFRDIDNLAKEWLPLKSAYIRASTFTNQEWILALWESLNCND